MIGGRELVEAINRVNVADGEGLKGSPSDEVAQHHVDLRVALDGIDDGTIAAIKVWAEVQGPQMFEGVKFAGADCCVMHIVQTIAALSYEEGMRGMMEVLRGRGVEVDLRG